jgi:tRNA_anti-like
MPSIIRCPGCGKSFRLQSNEPRSGISCPNCKKPLGKHSQEAATPKATKDQAATFVPVDAVGARPWLTPSRIALAAGLGGLLLVLTLSLVFVFSSRNPSTNVDAKRTSTTVANGAPKPPGFSLFPTNNDQITDISDLIAEYSFDPASADNRFKGKTLRLGALVGSRQPPLMLFPVHASTTRFSRVQLVFADENKTKLSELKKGRTLVFFKGRCDGIIMDTKSTGGPQLRISECELEEPPPANNNRSADGRYTRLGLINSIFLKRDGDKALKSLESLTPLFAEGKRFVLVAGRFEQKWWTDQFGDFQLKPFMDPVDKEFLTPDGHPTKKGVWTIQCSDGPVTMLGEVIDAKMSQTR